MRTLYACEVECCGKTFDSPDACRAHEADPPPEFQVGDLVFITVEGFDHQPYQRGGRPLVIREARLVSASHYWIYKLDGGPWPDITWTANCLERA